MYEQKKKDSWYFNVLYQNEPEMQERALITAAIGGELLEIQRERKSSISALINLGELF